jgi:putative tryptophan/tyrosine transport system substrate-binding protein
MRRREFIAGLGGAAAWPMVAGAQQTALPVIGFLHSSAFTEARRGMLAAFRQGLAEWGYIVDGNVAVEYHWAEDQYDRLPALAVDLVRRNVAVIITMVNSQAALAAKAATQTVPIVFVIGADPVRVRLVAGLARPGGNVTGLTVLSNEVVSKRLELLRQLVPTATAIAFLYNPTNIANEAEEVQDAARALGVRVVMMNASDRNGIEAAFRVLVERQAGALLVSADPLFGYSTMNMGQAFRTCIVE